MSEEKGVFTVSLDTELAWGTFDIGRTPEHEPAYRRTPDVIRRLCDLFDEYEVPATWAIVSHLLEDCDEGAAHVGRAQPSFDWIDGWFDSLPCTSGLDRELWHAPWLLPQLQECDVEQDIGLHSATHMQLGASGCSRENATEELGTAVETLKRHGLTPSSFVFPRNDIGHLDVVEEHGIQTYRGVDARWYERGNVPGMARPPLRFVDELTRCPPRVVTPKVQDNLVNVPGSQVFRPRQGGWRYTPSGNTVARAKKGLNRAAETGRVFHLWFHPFNLAHQPDTDLARLERVLQVARKLVKRDKIECRSMRSVATEARDGRWN